MSNISVCTIYAKRKLHLQNLVESLNRSTLQPDELIIVCMNDRLPDLPQTFFKVKTDTIFTDNRLPLATARTKSAEIATGKKLIFLDVDCICDCNLISNFNYHLNREEALYQGSVRYLRSGWHAEDRTFKNLLDLSSPNKIHGDRIMGNNKISHPYELFWSLCFGINKQTFIELGGFDSRYIGYGGEDTDFAFTARLHRIPLYKINALAYHQFHPACDPPLNHLEAIVSNAKVFYDKWQILPMRKWLDRFARMGYIKLEGDRLEILRLPSETDIKACQKEY
ncbi:glycosyltransferase family 2 protein [Myxosarcina sp. GI1]|uniref:glycosyltransferase family 2 protein n=1 Tax=Myxosarcina sp. GI1 TaxID=1541065 RepID=UPI00068B7656|nr:glycosyltransferase family 2 protein [Myxosarcina sp. GI1]